MRPFRFHTFLPVIASLVFIVPASFAADENPFTKLEEPPIVGRWDLKVRDGEKEYPSWLEVRLSGFRTLVGSYVGQFGSARPISEITFEKATGSFRFVIPPQWERRTSQITFEGRVDGELLRGTTTNPEEKPVQWEGRRAPSLVRTGSPKWREPARLFNGRDLSGWKQRNPAIKNGWKVKEGILANAEPGNDLLTEQQFTDFKLRAEFRYPRKSNSGIYLRGRYEVQLEDNFGKAPDSHYIGGVYGFLTPRVNAARKADEWQTIEMTLLGRVVTIVLNDEAIIERQAIPGITGGALDSDEAKPGPILLQGDHGPVEFKDLTIIAAE